VKGNQSELREAVIGGVRESEVVAEKLSVKVGDYAKALRGVPSRELFDEITVTIGDLQSLLEAVSGINTALTQMGQDTGHLKCWEKASEIFKAMVAAFERQDWLALADIMQYELKPLITEGKAGFKYIGAGLDGYNA